MMIKFKLPTTIIEKEYYNVIIFDNSSEIKSYLISIGYNDLEIDFVATVIHNKKLILFSKDNLSYSTVAHELSHLAFKTCESVMKPKFVKDGKWEAEERFCMNLDFLIDNFYKILKENKYEYN